MAQPTSTDQPQEHVSTVGGGGFRVPLNPPIPLAREDGSFDGANVHNRISRIILNRRQILANRGLKDQDLAEFEDLTGSVPLIHKSTLWTVPISIGSNDQPFTVQVDTGSSYLWVPNIEQPSSGRNSYDATTSTTSQEEDGTFSTTYLDGNTVSGPVYNDIVTIGSVKVAGQHFSAVVSISDSYSKLPVDGIFGLGFESHPSSGAVSFIQNAAKQNQIPAPIFGLRLANTNPSISLGGPDNTAYKGTIEYHDTSSKTDRALPGASVIVNGKVAASGFKTSFYSGVEVIFGPPDVVKAVYDAIPGSKVHDKVDGTYSYPTATPPIVSFKWGGKEWTISAENFSIEKVGGGQSVGALIGKDVGVGTNTWLIGDRFLRNVYSVFEFGEPNRVGFAELA